MLRLFLAVCVLLTTGGAAKAEPGPIGKWLMREPLTLWDMGMMRIEDATEAAAATTFDNHSRDTFPLASYSWEENEISISAWVVGFTGPINHQTCNSFRRRFVRALIGYAPDTAKVDDTQLKTEIVGQIEWWFSHSGWQKTARDKKLGEKMSRIIYVEVDLWKKTAPSGPRISCRDRVTSLDAPSKPRGNVAAVSQ